MEAAHLASQATGLADMFGQAHFGACVLGDQRLVKRAVVTADALLRHPGGTLPHKLPRKELLGFYALANNPKVNHQNVLEAHQQHTRAAMQECRGTVLVIHDTTEADYSGLSIDDLGPIGHGGNRGLLLHNVLAVDYARRQVLGLVGQFVHCRRRVPRGETKAASRRHPQRESRLWVRGVEAVGTVRLLAPRMARGEYTARMLDVWVVHVQEIDAPRGVEALEWFLLTNVPTAIRKQAWERVDWYECRPLIEEYHKAQKTGCGMELPQFTTRKALEVTMAMVSVVAVQLLRLRDLARQPDAASRRAAEVIDGEYIEVLSRWRFRQARRDLSVQEFLSALARLGGHLGRRQDRLPGWLVLWRGWMDLQRLVDGARLMYPERSG